MRIADIIDLALLLYAGAATAQMDVPSRDHYQDRGRGMSPGPRRPFRSRGQSGAVLSANSPRYAS